MGKNYKIKISCETQELKEAMLQILMMSKQQLVHHITHLLNSKGVESDTKISVQDDELIITSKTGDIGMVIVSSGIGFESAGYDTLAEYSKYLVVKDGGVQLYVKMPDNVDRKIATYDSLELAIENINSNDVVDAVNNLRTPKTLKMNGEDAIEDGDTENSVQ